MVYLSNRSTRWNIFARELEDVLTAHGLRLSQLNDRGVVYHPEKVRRLQQSLKSPRHLATLNPEEMERLDAIMKLTDIERQRLHAALLATAVEMTLMDRIDPETALMASDDVFNILFAVMKTQPQMAMATGVKAGAMADDVDTTTFTHALDLIDRATLMVHVSQHANSPEAQVVHTREAHDLYARSMELLQQAPDHESETWDFWYNEALHGREMTAPFIHPREGEAA